MRIIDREIECLEDRCFGCGACCNVAPDNFTFGDDGRTVMISPNMDNIKTEEDLENDDEGTEEDA